ncbi:MAG: carbohydrate kinase family protein [Planctomycetota bacterium]|jgi:ribokinase
MSGQPKRPDVFGLGQCVVDRLAIVDRHPGADEKREVLDWQRDCGGPVSTALVALARWGRDCVFAGVIGDDDEGRFMLEDFAREGVDTGSLLVRAGARSQVAFVAVEQATGRRRIYWQRSTGEAPRVGEIETPPARVFLTDGLYAAASVDCARKSERTVVDAGTLREGTEALIGEAEVFVASESFARAWMGGDDPEGCCRKLREAGVAIAGVTLGAAGFWAAHGDICHHRPAHALPAGRVVDTTGCGDVFHAGICEGLLAGWPTERCFDFAAFAAARCATALGGRAGIPAPPFPSPYGKQSRAEDPRVG